MPKTFLRDGQLQFCSLITCLVDDYAIDRGILSPVNITRVLFYFMRLAQDEEVLSWLSTKTGQLKVNHWLQALNYLYEEDIFIVGKKSLLSTFLLEHSDLHTISNSRNIQSTMCRSIDPAIEKLLRLAYHDSFC